MITLKPVAHDGELPEGGGYSCTPAWAALCRDVYAYDLRGFAILRDGEPAGGLRCAALRSPFFGRRLVSMPFSDESGLWLKPGVSLSGPERAELAAAAASVLDGLAADSRSAFAELRGAELLAGGPFTETSPYLRLTLDTSKPYAELRSRFHVNIIKNLRKADRTVEVEESRDPGAAAAVYDIYVGQMRGFGSPPLPRAHFERLLAAGLGRMYTARVSGRAAAMLFAIVHGGTFYADVNAGLPEYRAFFPKIRLFDHTIRLACAEGLRTYDFMRTRAGSGVHEHKLKWGGAAVPIKYYSRVYRKGASTALDPEQARFALPRLILRLAPAALLKAVGPSLRRHTGK